MARVRDKSARFVKRIEAQAHDSIYGVARAAATMVRRRMGTEGGGPFEPRISKFTGRVWYKGQGAPPGRFPAVRSGKLRRSIKARKTKLGARYGTSLGFAVHTHIRNPFLVRVLKARGLQAEFVNGMRKGSLGVEIQER